MAARRVRLSDPVSVSENAYRLGGSQIWLELGENMSVKDLFIAVAVASANDAAYALAEHAGGDLIHRHAGAEVRAAEEQREQLRRTALMYYAGYAEYEKRAGGRDLGFFLLTPVSK